MTHAGMHSTSGAQSAAPASGPNSVAAAASGSAAEAPQASATRTPRRVTAATARADTLMWLKRRFPTLYPKASAWARLVKLELSFVASMSSAFGYLLAGSSSFSAPHVLACFAGTIACASSAAIANQMLEIKWDGMMARTARRPLVTGEISRSAAALACVSGIALGFPSLLYAAEGAVAAPLIGVSTVALYALVYTPLKRIHRWNTEFGAIVGSLPVWVGWTCAVGHWAAQVSKQAAATATANGMAVSAAVTSAPIGVVESLLLPHALYGFLFQVAWQMQHFMTLAFLYQDQYGPAGYQMMRDESAYWKGAVWTGILCAMPAAAVGLGVTGHAFLLTSTAINLFLVRSYNKWRLAMQLRLADGSPDDVARKRAARGTLKDGIIYFFLMFAAILAHALDSPHHHMESIVPDKVKGSMEKMGAALCPVINSHATEQATQQAADSSAAQQQTLQPQAQQEQQAPAPLPLTRGSFWECTWRYLPWNKQEASDAQNPAATAHSLRAQSPPK